MGDVVDLPGGREVDRLRLQLRKAEERIEALEFDLAEARGEHALKQAVPNNQVWFVPLTPIQARIMETICEVSPNVISQQAILERIYESGREPQANGVAVQLCRMRALLAPVGVGILNDRGRGWRVSSADAERWRRWCARHGEGGAPSDDFRIDPDLARNVTGQARRQQRFVDDIRAAARLLDDGVAPGEIAGRIGRPLDFVRVIAGRARAATSEGRLTGRNREAVIDEAVRRTLAETPVTLPDTARRTAGHAVDLMSEEGMAMIAGGET